LVWVFGYRRTGRAVQRVERIARTVPIRAPPISAIGPRRARRSAASGAVIGVTRAPPRPKAVGSRSAHALRSREPRQDQQRPSAGSALLQLEHEGPIARGLHRAGCCRRPSASTGSTGVLSTSNAAQGWGRAGQSRAARRAATRRPPASTSPARQSRIVDRRGSRAEQRTPLLRLRSEGLEGRCSSSGRKPWRRSRTPIQNA